MRTLEINLLGPMLATKYAIPHMLESGGGAIVNTSSVAASVGRPNGTAYAASKAALESLTRLTAVQYGKQGIRCNAIAPGITLSPTALASMSPADLELVKHSIQVPAISETEDQATVAAFLLSDDARQVNGQVISTGGGVNIVSTTNALFAYAAAITGAHPVS